MIGSGDKVQNLYYLVMIIKIVCRYSSNSIILPDHAIWNFRLGHILVQYMDALHSKFPFINVNSKSVYDVCHFAKQRKLPFQAI